jgi:hypothetical protein
MLRCKKYYAAMQTNGLFLVSGMPTFGTTPLHWNKGDKMSKTASLGFAPSATLFGRLMSTIDRLLMASARIAIRNGDLPYFGL